MFLPHIEPYCQKHSPIIQNSQGEKKWQWQWQLCSDDYGGKKTLVNKAMKEFLVMANANEIEDEPPRVDDDVDEDSQGTECADFEDDEEGLEDEH